MNFDVIKAAQSVIETEIVALTKTKLALDEEFCQIIDLIFHCRGKLVITGIGKPGHIGCKMAASFASLGTPSFYLHPSEAMHGDLGMLGKEDIVMLLSYSGESNEVTALLPVIKEIGCETIAITGKADSTLSKQCKYRFIFPHFEEACYLHLAPTSSTTALLALGDAMAVVLSKLRNYTREDFGLHHPAGALGRKLLIKVADIMHKESDNAVVKKGCSLKNAIVEMSSKGLSMVTIVDDEDILAGILTDGDLRRMLEHGVDVYSVCIDDVMTKSPMFIDYHEMAVDALQFMNDKHITSLPVVDENKHVIGAILMQDIMKAGITN